MPISNSTDRFNGVLASLANKVPCVAWSNLNLTLSGEQTVNGIAIVSGDRVLVMSQTDPIENGIYNASASEWTRAADFDGNRDVTTNTTVLAGVNGQKPIVFRCTTSTLPIIIDTSSITFELFFAASDVVLLEDLYTSITHIYDDGDDTTIMVFTDSEGNIGIMDPSMSAIIPITDDYTFGLKDKGMTASRTGSTAGVAITIPPEATTNFRVGTFLGFNNDGTDDITIEITTDTLTWADTNTTGTRTLAPGGYAVAQKTASAKWKIAGKNIS